MRFSGLSGDLFVPCVLLSITGHFLLLRTSIWEKPTPQFTVLNAPNTVEVKLIEEVIIPKKIIDPKKEVIEPIIPEPVIEPEEEIIAQDIVTEEIVEEVIEIPMDETVAEVIKKVEEEIVEPEIIKRPEPIQKIEQKQIIIEESQGAISEATPLKHKNLAPLYPRLAKRRGWEGIVLLLVKVDLSGHAADIQIEKSSGYKILDESAIKSVSRWKFMPATKGNAKFVSTIKVPIQFRLVD